MIYLLMPWRSWWNFLNNVLIIRGNWLSFLVPRWMPKTVRSRQIPRHPCFLAPFSISSVFLWTCDSSWALMYVGTTLYAVVNRIFLQLTRKCGHKEKFEDVCLNPLYCKYIEAKHLPIVNWIGKLKGITVRSWWTWTPITKNSFQGTKSFKKFSLLFRSC